MRQMPGNGPLPSGRAVYAEILSPLWPLIETLSTTMPLYAMGSSLVCVSAGKCGCCCLFLLQPGGRRDLRIARELAAHEAAQLFGRAEPRVHAGVAHAREQVRVLERLIRLAVEMGDDIIRCG